MNAYQKRKRRAREEFAEQVARAYGIRRTRTKPKRKLTRQQAIKKQRANIARGLASDLKRKTR